MGNLLQVERFTLPCLPLLLIQDFRDPPITIIVQQTVDLGNHLRLRLSKLSNWQWLGDSQGPGGAATKTHLNLNHISINQRHIFDEQTQNAFPLAGFDARIIPDAGKVVHQGEQLLPGLRVNQETLFLGLLLVLFLGLGQGTQLVIPFGFQAASDKPMIGIDVHEATAGKFSVVLCSLNMLPS